MSSTANRPVCILISALGGQGGGVLVDWLVSAARAEGLAAQATSIPGVAQRTGATTYYFEVYPRRDDAGARHFSIYPAAGSVDLLLSFEPMEAGRAMAGGLVGGETTVITARDRVISTAEKVLPGNGILDAAPVLEALDQLARSVQTIDLRTAAEETGAAPNALMFGALSASGVLPFGYEACRAAIAGSGKAVKANLAGFEAGRALPKTAPDPAAAEGAGFDPAPKTLAAEVEKLPMPVQAMAGHACARLADYQNDAYARLYLDRLGRVAAVDSAENGWRLTQLAARRLGAWMAFEDVIRVAQLKTRPGRLARIRRELGAPAGAPLTVHEFLKPGREELIGLLPAPFAPLLGRERPVVYGRGLAMRLRTTGPLGWLSLRLLSRLRGWRPWTARYRQEQAMIGQWVDAMLAAAREDYGLACDTAELAAWVRGYGETRHRGFRHIGRMLEEFSARLAADSAALAESVRAGLEAAHSDQDREVKP
ncbi:indolepyruvate oxidoreductase subunit beta family protein [Roseovarius amoyensis]|uniref:indolepyruvate oxidoreductase subunit beta family protein n=1 Tax=Roseovarius amoyensis TaxID=2211448 RepID=UPI0013A6D4B5|nr:indolepyruvate oxidoreductase subunit beta family protein [Roseovarius amoyensis]